MPLQNFGTNDGPDHSEPPDSTEVKCGAFWEAIGCAFLFLIGGWIACAIRWTNDERCQLWDDITQNWEEAFPGGAYGAAEISSGGPQALTADDVAAISQRPDRTTHRGSAQPAVPDVGRVTEGVRVPGRLRAGLPRSTA